MFLLPDYVKFALNALKQNGFDAYIVGGAVRDLLLNKEPDDFDITTNALPEDVVAIFDKTIPTGIQHGTVTVLIENKSIEITTFRTDGNYADHRSPENVKFTKNITEDLSRRDFTVNAIAYNEDDGIIDNFSGEKDIKNRIIRAVGNPHKRFTEDALRILRAYRFAAVLNFEIEEKTLYGISQTANLLSQISVERVFTELIKTLLSNNPQIIEGLINFNGLKFLGIEKIKDANLLSKLPKNKYLRFFAFCYLCNIDSLYMCQLLKTDNALKKHCKNLCLFLKYNFPNSKTDIKLMMKNFDEESVLEYIQLIGVLFNIDGEKLIAYYNEIIRKHEPYKISQLDINGDEIISMGYKNEAVGNILNLLIDNVIESPSLNTKEELKKLINNSN